MSVRAARLGIVAKSRLTSNQVVGLWAARSGWTLDGIDSFIYALVLAPALTELLPRSGTANEPADVAAIGSVLVALFLTVMTFGVIFYKPDAPAHFIGAPFFIGLAGGNFALFTLWLPEQYDTSVRATAFAFCTSIGRFIGAAINCGIPAGVRGMGTLGTPIVGRPSPSESDC